VPVYGLGHDADGRPYYAMRFVRGDSLKEAADRFHADEALKKNPGARNLELQKLLRRFLAVCDAIGYAHQRGVLHRDIKPSNVILGKHGETLVVDWGLAKAVGVPEDTPTDERTLRPSSASGSADTLPGSALGTPAYMSPEQAAGELDRLGPRSDVYSLGATLYYVLAGRSPFEGDVADVLRAVQAGDVRPVRQSAAWVDPALEAVCLKAMARRPEDRYASARALAMDVERWLADEPVTAYAEPWRRRLSRWERRHKALVQAGGLGMLLAIVALLVTLAAVREQKRISDAARAVADEKKEEALANYQNTLALAYRQFNVFSSDTLADVPGMTKLRLEFAGSAAEAFRFVTPQSTDPTLLHDASRVFQNQARALSSVGRKSEAWNQHQEVLRLRTKREKLLPQPVSAEDLMILNDALLTMVMFLQENAQNVENPYHFEDYLRQARARTDEALARPPGAPDSQAYRNEHAGRVDLVEAQYMFERGELARARALYTRAIERLTEALRTPRGIWNRLYLARAHRWQALVAHEAGDEATADRSAAEAVRWCRAMAELEPLKQDPKSELAWALEATARRLIADPSRGAEADAALAEVWALADDFCKKFPEEVVYPYLRARVLLTRGLRAKAAGKDDEALRLLEEAVGVATWQALHGDTYNNNLQLLSGLAHLALAEAYLKAERVDDATKQNREALMRFKVELERHPWAVGIQKAQDEARALQSRIDAAAAAKVGGGQPPREAAPASQGATAG
jgi:hypothetical protein